MQLGAMITQVNRHITFFIGKLSEKQTKYSVTKIKLLTIVKTLKEFWGMLWGQTMKVYTDHKNLTQDTLGLTSDRVYCWWLSLEEFAPKIVCIKGFYNTVTDAISWLDYNLMVNPTNEYNHAMLGMSAKGETNTKLKTFSKLWCFINKYNTRTQMQECNLNQVFGSCSNRDGIFCLKT